MVLTTNHERIDIPEHLRTKEFASSRADPAFERTQVGKAIAEKLICATGLLQRPRQ